MSTVPTSGPAQQLAGLLARLSETDAEMAAIGDPESAEALIAELEQIADGIENPDPAAFAALAAITTRLLRAADAERDLRERQTAENARLVDSLAERQRLLERLSKIQSSIVSRRDLQEVLDAIVTGAHELVGDETVGLRLIDPDDPGHLILVASAGVKPEIVSSMRRSPIGLGAGGQAAATGIRGRRDSRRAGHPGPRARRGRRQHRRRDP
jgi:hypothetical protein